ncbi:MAG: dihydrofolate reductase [Candidatus Delongbacteria bacterium]|jgi:dihydrofolate reductase|nr:dihydrofolate reductase [Candidatus Delongbacteria bacterium]
MSFSIIVAIAKNRGIGKNNDLLYYIKDDLKRFKKITTGHNIIMGRNTFLSLPNGPLPNRKNIVITDNPEDCSLPDKYPDRECIMVDSIEKAIKQCNPNEENFIIGGGSIYKQFFPYADKLYLTIVHEEPDADIFFPDYNNKMWKEIWKEDHFEHKPPYSDLILERVGK